MVVASFDKEPHRHSVYNLSEKKGYDKNKNEVNIILDTLLNNESCQHAELIFESSVSDRVVIATFVKETAIAMRNDELINDSIWVLKQGIK